MLEKFRLGKGSEFAELRVFIHRRTYGRMIKDSISGKHLKSRSGFFAITYFLVH